MTPRILGVLLLLGVVTPAYGQDDSATEAGDPVTALLEAAGDDPRAQILALEDARVSAASPWRRLLAHETPAVRARAAQAAGRVQDDPLAWDAPGPRLAALLLERVEAETDATVREALVFGLGQLGDVSARGPLNALTNDLKTPAGLVARSLEALGKLGDPAIAGDLLPWVGDPRDAVCGAALLGLVRLRGRRVSPPAPFPPAQGKALCERLAALATRAPAVRWRTAYALAELTLPGRFAALQALLTAAKATDATRLFCVRGLARLEDAPESLAAVLLEVLSGDPNVHVAAAAATAMGKQVLTAEAEEALLAAAAREDDPADHHLRTAALTALVAAASDPELADEVKARVLAVASERLADSSVRVRTEGLIAVARLEGIASASEQVAAVLASQQPLDRLGAVSASLALAERAGPAYALTALRPLCADDDARVACAALDGVGAVDTKAARKAALVASARDDMAIRATALGLLGEHGLADDVAMIHSLVEASPGPEGVETRQGALAAAAGMAARDVARERATDLLRAGLNDPALSVRRAAFDALTDLLGERPAGLAPRPTLSPSSVELTLETDVFSDAENPVAVLSTSRGVLRIELLREDAPRHVKSFVERATRGDYNGLSVHRIVSGFVAQGLDPRGDGWGTGGVHLRDEINPVPYGVGALGMPNAGKDTGGCQVFLTYLPTPHLDGRYTVFGRLLEGHACLDALDVGDVVERVEIR